MRGGDVRLHSRTGGRGRDSVERLTLRWTLAGAGVVMMGAGVAVGATHTGASHSTSHATRTPPAPSATVTPQRANPLLPVAIAVEGFFPDLSLVQKLPSMTPTGFTPLYTAEDWQNYRKRFGVEADELPRKKSSGQIEFAQKLIAAAEADESPRAATTQSAAT